MRAEIISVGTELLLGDIVNTNAQFLAQQLAGLGYTVHYQTVVGDNATRLRAVVEDAKERSDILIITGGLGPTEDDLTKETVADIFGDFLVPDAEELVKLEHFFKNRGIPMAESNKKQAMVPRLGRKLLNDVGTAPGAFFRQGNKYAILLPGPPREMQPMFVEQVMPLLEAMQDASIRSVTLRVFGMGESSLEEKVRPLLEGSNPTAALYAKTGEVHIRITAKADTAEQADVMCDEMAGLFRRALGDMVYSLNGDSLEAVAVGRLLADGYTVATAESCTGGMLGERITSVPGASGAYDFGVVTYANETKHQLLGVRNSTLRKYGAVSSQVAAEMAFGAARKGHADFGIGITGIAGPDGGTAKKPVGLVYVAVSSGRQVFVKKLELGDRGRTYVRELATLHALDMLRRLAGGLALPDSKSFQKGQLADYEREGRPLRRGRNLLRAAIALLAVGLILLLIIVGANLSQEAPSAPSSANSGAPSARGLVYGTDEYTAAAMDMVRQQQAENPAVAGFLALPGGRVETLVAQAANGVQKNLSDAQKEPGINGMPVMGTDAVQSAAGANPLLLGGAPFEALWDYQHGNMADSLSTFTYYTGSENSVYKVLAVYLANQNDAQGDAFDPAVRQVTGYSGFLSFLLGAKARSLYDIPLDVSLGDSFMTLTAVDVKNNDHRLYIIGRRQRHGESVNTPAAFTAGSPLMPSVWYEQNDQAPPDIKGIYNWWLQWYLTRNTSNSQLQLEAGMPAKDAGPTVSATGRSATVRSVASSSSPAVSTVAAPLMGMRTPAAFSAANFAAAESAPNSTTDDGSMPDSSAAASSYPRVLPRPIPKKTDPYTLTVTMNGRIVTDSTVNILAQICQAEAGNMEPEAIRAVAISAHSWILNQQGAGNTAPAVIGSIPTQQVVLAVQQVERLIVSPDDENPAFTPWFYMAAHGTNNARNIWGEGRTYLDGAPSGGEQGMEGWTQMISISADDLSAAAADVLDIDLPGYNQDAGQWISNVVRSDNGYVESLQLADTTVTGFELWDRVLLSDGLPRLPSPAFEVEFDGENYNFICYGQGHGVGLSLYGANAYAQQGWSHQTILENYFPGCTLTIW